MKSYALFFIGLIVQFSAVVVLAEPLSQAVTLKQDNHKIQKRVMAFYYPWYGLPDGPGGKGKAVHWGKIDPDKKDIQESRDYPALGAYDSHNPDIVRQHCQWATQVKIDTFIVSWWGHGCYEDQVMPLILDTCDKFKMNACIYYEAVPDPKTPQAAADDIKKLLDKYAGHSAYLKHSNKPVVFVYGRALQEIGLYGWYQAKQLLNDNFKAGVVLIGDQMDYAASCVFEGLHTYNTCGQLYNKNAEQIQNWTRQQYGDWCVLTQETQVISTITVIPGYDDTKIRKPGLNTRRMDGQLYQLQWEAVLLNAPDWVLITSFNEWHEGSEIEPSEQYGSRYLQLTEQYAGKFKALPPGPMLHHRITSFNDRPNPELRSALRTKTIAVLPEPQSLPFWYLFKCGAKIKILSWQEAAQGINPESYPMLLYAGGEKYCPTVNKTGDVDDSIITYLNAGGTLIVLPCEPFPFYYDQAGKVVNNASKFSLSIRQGWEKSPPGKTLTFLPPQKSILPLRQIHFPEQGDLRWRPFIADKIANVQTLLELKDEAGNSFGGGLVIVHPQTGGTVVYGWSGLVNGQDALSVIPDLFTFLTTQ